MRIAVLSPRDPIPIYTGLLERVYQLCRYLGARHQVRLLYPCEKEEKATATGRVPQSQPFDRIGLESRSIDTLEPRLPEYSALRGIYHTHPWLYPAVRRELKQFDPSAILVEFPYLMPLARLASRGLGCRIVLTEHNVEYRLAKRVGAPLWRILYFGETIACKLADNIVTVSETDRETLQSHLPRTPVKVAPNGVDVGRYRPDASGIEPIKTRYGLTGPVVCYHGNLGNAQNSEAVDRLLETVFPRIREAVGNASLLLLGADPPDVDRSWLITPGVVDNLPAHLAAADAAAVPLVSGSGTKLKILEYLASGVPVATTPVGAEGLPLSDGATALIAEQVAGVAENTTRLLQNPSLGRRIATAGRDLAVARFSWSKTLRTYEDLLRKG